ncbi:serine/threonine-protein kinase [Catenulispora subtropica]|uniref:Protein kinase domain-containing protein n=1 Tax=Catenulispora subtropica TaxID=450798 RepID=A0ABP5EBP8_9ACTN
MQTLGAGDPQRIGPYILTARLGTGGMGSVYLGWDPDGRPAAVKVVRQDFLQDPDFRARFRREISSARRVSGPWISRVLDADPDAESPWLATEYVAGPTLDAAVTRFGPLPTETVAVLAECLGQALRAVHEAGVVHRDIKPNNILLAADGPRLIDFGIARATDDTKLTATHAGVFGVAGFIAPERIERQALLPAGDVFAGGAVLSFAATGRMAFGGGEPVTVAYRVVHAEPDLADLPEELRPLVTACLAKDPAQRPDAGRMAATAARLRGTSDWPGVPTTPDWSDASATDDTYELASTWLPEPLARHTVRDYDLTAGFAAAETARLNLARGGGAGSGAGAGGQRFDTPRFETPRMETRLPTPPPMVSPYNPGPPPAEGGPRGRGRQAPPSRKKPVAIISGVALAVVAVAGAVMFSSQGSDHKDSTALQGATASGQSSAPGQSPSGKDASDISGNGSAPRSGDNVPTSAAAPASGGNPASNQAPSSSGGAPAGGQQPSSSGGSTAHPPSSSASHSTTAAPPSSAASTSKPAPSTSQPAPPAPAPVPCSGTTSTSQGTGYNCPFDTPGDGSSGGSPVYTSSGSITGYLHQGTNWVLCQATGRTQHQGQYYNKWWAWTASDHGGWGWVNAVSAAGGDNDGDFGGVPLCDGAHGAPPA